MSTNQEILKKPSNEPSTAYQQVVSPQFNPEFEASGFWKGDPTNDQPYPFDSQGGDSKDSAVQDAEIEDPKNCWSQIDQKSDLSEGDKSLDLNHKLISALNPSQHISDSCSKSLKREKTTEVTKPVPKMKNTPESNLGDFSPANQRPDHNQTFQRSPETYFDRDTGITYKGDLVDGLLHGPGESSDPKCGFFQGNWENGKKTGQGYYRYLNGTVYTGEWLNDQLHGSGILVTHEGGIHDGEFKNGLPNGYGIRQDPDQSRYIGGWLNGERSGLGVFQKKNGAFYKGEWSDDLPNGFGELHSLDGSVYTGEFVHGMGQGRGTLSSRKFNYQGYWEEGFEEGYGVIEDPSGCKYEGMWRKGKRHGKGVSKNASGQIWEVDFIDGELVGGDRVERPDG